MENLLALPKEDIHALYEGKPQTQVMREVSLRGEALNVGNPWAGSSTRRDKLRARLGHWKAIGTDEKILSWLAYGCMRRFHTEPEEVSFRNPHSVTEHKQFVEEECRTSLGEGSAVSVDRSYARVINPIMVDRKKRNWKLRLCLDLRHPNSMTAAVAFRMASLLKNLPHMLQQGDIILTTDLEQAYHSVPLHHSAWAWYVFEGPDGSLLAPTVLCFGDSQAPFTFHKITRPMIAFAQLAQVRLLGY